MWASAALALILERFLGYPDAIYRRAGHPVEWAGHVLTRLEELLNTPDVAPWNGKVRGIAALLSLLAIAVIPALVISLLLRNLPFGWIIDAALASSLLAQHSLRKHVADVAKGLGQSLAEGRRAVAKIVGRDPARLNESGVVKGALESLAENTSDGVVAPILWYGLLGLPGIVAYKAINTADSMIGHKSKRYLHFGWASARLDDLVNLPASRLTGLLFAAVAAWDNSHRGRSALRIMWRDAGKHQSPNAGWPEAALAAALQLRFGGPRTYDGKSVDLPWMGEGRTRLVRSDITAGLKLYGRAMTLLLLIAVVFALVF